MDAYKRYENSQQKIANWTMAAAAVLIVLCFSFLPEIYQDAMKDRAQANQSWAQHWDGSK